MSDTPMSESPRKNEKWTPEDLLEIKNFFQTMDKDSFDLLSSFSSK
jgi:hypothetical protein